VIDQIEEQAEAIRAFREALFSILAKERRTSLIEAFLAALFFFLIGALISLATLAALGVFLALFFYRALARWNLNPMILGASALLILAAIRVRALLAFETTPRHISLWDSLSVDRLGPFSLDVISGILLIGPRCLALGAFEIRDLWKLQKVNLEKLIDPIELAFLRRRKISQRDLGEISLMEFLRDIAWFKGVIRLYAPPVGFVLSPEFRRRLRAWRDPNVADEPPQPEEPRSRQRREEPVEEVDENAREKAWALEILGLSGFATRAEIKRAYRQLAKVYHPDVRRGGSDAKMKDLNRAMEILERVT
jgi:hypothetical protein